jgi:hypothetical protein
MRGEGLVMTLPEAPVWMMAEWRRLIIAQGYFNEDA